MALVCITGATGYVASALVDTFLNHTQFRVRGTVRSLKDTTKVAHLRELASQHSGRLQIVEADLMVENSFDEAVKNCLFVFHTASPFEHKVKNPQKDLIEPAVKGTTNVLMSVSKWNKVAKSSDISVKRVVITSSVASIIGPNSQPSNGKFYTEADKNTTSTIESDPYPLSKVLAEQRAWEIAEKEGLDIVTIHPSFIIGPPLSPRANATSIRWMTALLQGQVRGQCFPCVDIRDVAFAHIRAAQYPKVKGRYIISHKHPLQPGRAAEIVKQAIPQASVDVEGNAKRNMPIPEDQEVFDNSRSIADLGVKYTPIEQSLADMAKVIWTVLEQQNKSKL